MPITGAAAYQNNASLLTNNGRLVNPAAPLVKSGNKSAATEATPVAAASDRVSLSPAVELARLRDSLGLPPTGTLTRQDFAARIKSDQEGVQKTLQANLDALAPAAGQPVGAITLSQDSKGQIQVAGDWPGKEALTKNLNADPDFKLMFTRLSANSGVLNATTPAQESGKSATLSDYLDGETADSNLATLLKNYSALKTAPNSLASLVGLGANAEKPFSLSFKAGGAVQAN